VYLVALDDSPDTRSATLVEAPISRERVAELLRVRPELRVDGSRPTNAELMDRLRGLWPPHETVLYIGLAGTSLKSRVGQYYSTRLGARRPHAGGWPLKTLANLDELTVHYATTDAPVEAEHALMKAFAKSVDREDLSLLHDPAHAYPYGNLDGPDGRKAHGITGAREPR
jgi:hypothetical protein